MVGLGSSSLQLGTFLLIDLPIKIPEEEFIRLAFLPEVPCSLPPTLPKIKSTYYSALIVKARKNVTAVDLLSVNKMISHLPLGFSHLF